MKIIHLADFHLDSEVMTVSHKRLLVALIEDLKNKDIDNETLLIFSGDFVNLGGKNFTDKSNIFQIFKTLILDEIYSNFPFLENNTFFVPGNHDLDRSKIKHSNKAFKRSIIEDLESRGDYYEELKEDLIGFEKYNKFKKEFYENLKYDQKKITNFESNFVFTLGEDKVGISAFNSSTLCYEKDDLGNLILFEKQLVNSLEYIHDCNIKIAILHHPLNFFHKSENEKIKEFLENEYDLVFVGHTHKQESAFNQSLNGNCYFSVGKSLNGENGSNSTYDNGYSIIDLTPNTSLTVTLRKFNNITHSFIANSDYGQENGIQTIIINKNLENESASKFIVRPSFKKYLSDVGANLTHKNKDSIKLDDIYIFPNLDNYDLSSEEKKLTVNSQSLLDKMKDDEVQRMVLLGETSSGKTSLCKKIFEKIFEKENFYPILIDGEDIKSTDVKILEKLKNNTLNEQYLSEKVPANKKPFFIIDNFNDSKLEPKYKRKFLENIINNDLSFCITWNEFFTFNEIFDSLVSLVNIYEILPFGTKYRYELIEKWISFTDHDNEKEKVTFLYEVEKLINSVIGKNLVPGYPLYILTLLQSTELFPSENFEQSTFGHYYDILIRSALSKFLSKSSDIEKYYSYLSEIAFALYTKKEKFLLEEEFISFHEKFVKDYNIQKNGFVEIERNLTNSDVLQLANAKYSFKYDYLYYYFLGKYLADNIENDDIQYEIMLLADSLYKTSSANTYLFLSHHSKSEFVTKTVLDIAKDLYKNEKIVNFSDDMGKINESITSTTSRIVLDTTKTYKENKLETFEEDEPNSSLSDVDEVEDFAETEGINYISEINKAFKTIEILGLILKNRYASLKTKPKLEIAQEVYFLGLRTTAMIFKILVEGEEFIKNDLLEIIGDEKTLSKSEKEELAKKIIFNMYYVTSYSIFKRISNSIAVKDLEPTFNDLKNKFPDNNAIALIDISNKLEYSTSFPFTEIDSLVAKLKNNRFPYFLLRRLSYNYLRMFPMKEQERQKICEKLEIPMKVQRQIEMQSLIKKK